MDETVVKISSGFLKGSIKKDINGNDFYSFEGIPFAEPPVGVLRFKAPVPNKSWEGVRDALCKGPASTCRDSQGIETSEDCLYLNVFTPSVANTTTELKSVVVYIHGGAFVEGCPHFYGPEVLITEDVVVVTVAYRLGALGFLNIDDPELGVTGNAGMKDLVLGLKWIQRSIEEFNGNPRNVTIYGESAGGASVQYLMLSPTTKGLFHRAIIYSGSTLSSWAIGQSNNGFTLAKHLGCTSINNEEILKFLQDLPVGNLLRGQDSLPNKKLVPSILRYFAPVVENTKAKDAFLVENPIDLIITGKYTKIPVIFGFNNDEGLLLVDRLGSNNETHIAESNVVPHWFNMEIGTEEYLNLARKIRSYYLSEDQTSKELTDRITTASGRKLAGDNSFVRPVLQSVKLHCKTSDSPIYVCRLSVATKLGYLTQGKTEGVCHGDDLGYTFMTTNSPKVEPGSIEDITRKRLVKLFTNFAKKGDPNPAETDELFPVKWEPSNKNELKLLDINVSLKMESNPETHCMNFWDEIFQSRDCTKYF